MSGPGVAVLTGRFEPWHRGHQHVLDEALRVAPRVVVVVGSAHQARTPKNPFTWGERADMILRAQAPPVRPRLAIVPVRDYVDPARWARAVRAEVGRLAPGPCVVQVGAGGDTQGGTPSEDPVEGWPLHRVSRLEAIDSDALRDAVFACAGEPADDVQGRARDAPAITAAFEHTLEALGEALPPTTADFLRAWLRGPDFACLAAQWRAVRRYHDAWLVAPYPPILVTVDAVVRCAGHVLLIRRGHAPGIGLLAMPGGFLEPRETLRASCLRELREETALEVSDGELLAGLRAVVVVDQPQRSQRGRTITHAHFFDLDRPACPPVRGGDDAAEAMWIPVAELAAREDRFHDDHFHVLDHLLGLTAPP